MKKRFNKSSAIIMTLFLLGFGIMPGLLQGIMATPAHAGSGQGSGEYVMTKFSTALRPAPNSEHTILTIPPKTPLRIEGKGNFQQYRYINTWYKVTFMGQTGWASAWNFEKQPEVKPVNVKEMNQRYNVEYGEMPMVNNQGVIPVIDHWIRNRSTEVRYIKWHEATPLNGYWAVHVTSREMQPYGGFETRDRVFGIKFGKVVDIKSPWDL